MGSAGTRAKRGNEPLWALIAKVGVNPRVWRSLASLSEHLFFSSLRHFHPSKIWNTQGLKYLNKLLRLFELLLDYLLLLVAIYQIFVKLLAIFDKRANGFRHISDMVHEYVVFVFLCNTCCTGNFLTNHRSIGTIFCKRYIFFRVTLVVFGVTV